MPSSSSPVTRASLVTRARQRADYLNSTFIDSTVNEDYNLVDTSLAKIHNFLTSLYQDYFTSITAIPILANVDTYPLPPDFFKERQVFYVDTSGFRWPLKRLNISDLTNIPISINYTSLPLGYVVTGQGQNTIVMFPKPAQSQQNSLQVFYIPQYKPPVSDSEPIEYSMAFGWDEWVVNDVAYQIRLKANEPAEEIFREREKLEGQIRAQAVHRDAGEPPRVRDTGWGGTSTYNRWSQFAIK